MLLAFENPRLVSFLISITSGYSQEAVHREYPDVIIDYNDF
jgi:hypothetical protein